MSDPRFNTGDPIMDAALAADDAKLEAMGVYDEPTNPPVPATPLDVEACVRLLNDLILMLAPHDAQSIADADQLRALASALPGMGKDSETVAALTAENAQLRETLTLGLGEQESVIAGLRAENERLTGLLARSLDYADHAICKLSDGYGDPCGCGYEQFRADAAAALPSSRETTDGQKAP